MFPGLALRPVDGQFLQFQQGAAQPFDLFGAANTFTAAQTINVASGNIQLWKVAGTTLATMDGGGNLALGAAVSSSQGRLQVTNGSAVTSGYGSYFTSTFSAGATSGLGNLGLFCDTFIQQSAAAQYSVGGLFRARAYGGSSYTTGSLTGSQSTVILELTASTQTVTGLVSGNVSSVELWGTNTGTITLNNAVGNSTGINLNVSGWSVVNAYGYYVNAFGNVGGGSITNAYGMYINGVGVGTNRWGIYQAGTDNNYFGGNLGIGVTPARKLHVVGVDNVNVCRLAGASYAFRVTSSAGVGMRIEATTADEVSYAPVLLAGSTATVDGATVTLNISGVQKAQLDSSGNLSIAASTASTSTTTGALVVTGGIGLGGSVVFDGASGKTIRYTNSTANGAVATTLGSVGPTGSTAGNPQGWLRVSIAGTDRYVPFW